MSDTTPNTPSDLRAMGPTFPYTKYPNASAGEPITFTIGPSPSPTRFSLHHHLLTTNSPLFTTPAGLPRIIPNPIRLETTDPIIFRLICTWLYDRKPPPVSKASDLLLLMALWVTLGKLGLWTKMNTVMRLGMALMQPGEFVCAMETVTWVYQNTRPGCRLRGYVVAIFCQRGPGVAPEMFTPENERLGIFADASAFMRKLGRVRSGNPMHVDGVDLGAVYPSAWSYVPGNRRGEPGRVFRTLVTQGREVEWAKIVYPLPSFLVWGEKWETLPDEHFFVLNYEEVKSEGAEVLGQLKGRARRGRAKQARVKEVVDEEFA